MYDRLVRKGVALIEIEIDIDVVEHDVEGVANVYEAAFGSWVA